MDFGDPWLLTSGILIGMVGFVMFTYGRKQESPPALLTGLILCVYPYFVSSLLVTWLIFAAILAGTYWFVKRG